MTQVFFFISTVLFVITIYHVFLFAGAGVYPSRYILKKRATACAIGSILFLLIGLFIR